MRKPATLATAARKLALTVDGPVDYKNIIGDISLVADQSGQVQEALIKADGARAWLFQTGKVPDGK